MAQDAWSEAAELQLAMEVKQAEHMRYVEYGTWIRAFNIHYFLGVDGLSLPLLILTGLLGIICIYYSFNIEKGVKGYMALFLLLETGLLGVFSRSTSSSSTSSGKSSCSRCTS